jgi:hypothetical protein
MEGTDFESGNINRANVNSPRDARNMGAMMVMETDRETA